MSLPPQEPNERAGRLDSNAWLKYIAIPQYAEGTPEAQQPLPPGGLLGKYEATFLLGVPGQNVFTDAVTMGDLSTFGDSLLAMSREFPSLRISMTREGGKDEIHIHSNAEHHLARVVLIVSAPNFKEAERTAFDLVMPLLSWLSFRQNVGLNVTGYQVCELRSGVIHAVHGILGRLKGMTFDAPPLGVASTPEGRLLLSAYREALNATSPFYRLLCLYKVVEGIGSLRDARRQATVAAGQPYRAPGERMPELLEDFPVQDEFERDKFQPHLGKKFTKVVDRYREVYRNAIAHLDPRDRTLIADKYEDVVQVQEASTVLQYVARVMLEHELASGAPAEGPTAPPGS